METEPALSEPALSEEQNTIAGDVDKEFSAREQIKIVTSDLRVLIDNELKYYKARLAYTRTVAKWTSVYLLISICAFFGCIVACILGALLIVSSYFGPILGTIFVAATSLIFAILFAFIARRKSKEFRVMEIDKPTSDE